MKTIDLKAITEDVKPILMQYDVKFAGIFGSYARGDEKPSSDVDILIDFNKPISFVEFFNMKESISEKLEKEVDIVSAKSILPYFKDYINKDLKIIYGER
jgi:predicted nucleotidyltransferase